MKRYSAQLTLCGLAMAFFVVGVSPQTDLAISRVAAEETQSKSPGNIELLHCRIKLKKKAQVASDRPGILDTIKLEKGTPKIEEGVRVEKGALIAQLKADVAAAAYRVASLKATDKTEIEYAILARDQAKKEIEIAEKSNLDQPGAVPEIEMQRLKLEWEKSKAAVTKAEKQKEIATEQAKEAKAQLDTYKVLAPFAGVITRKLKTEGEAVRQGDPILEIVNTDSVIVEGYVHYSDRSRIALGNIVWASQENFSEDGTVETTTGQQKPLQGKIVFIDESVQKISRKILIKVEFDIRKESLLPGQKPLLPGLTSRMTIEPKTKSKQ